jgi:hypothetical protein
MNSIAIFAGTLGITLLLLTGCGPKAPPALTPTLLASFAPGVTRCDEIVERIGTPPQRATTRANGTRELIYVSSDTQVKPETYIPIVGQFAGGATVNQTATTFECDAQGVLMGATTATEHREVGPGTRR